MEKFTNIYLFIAVFNIAILLLLAQEIILTYLNL